MNSHQHHKLIRSLIDRIRELEEQCESLEWTVDAEYERAQRIARRAAEEAAAFERERREREWEELRRWECMREAQRALERGDTHTANRLLHDW